MSLAHPVPICVSAAEGRDTQEQEVVALETVKSRLRLAMVKLTASIGEKDQGSAGDGLELRPSTREI